MISKEDLEFLAELSEEMRTQDNDGQAEPRYWTVRGIESVPSPDGYGDGLCVYCNSLGETVAENLEELIMHFEEECFYELELADIEIKDNNNEYGKYLITGKDGNTVVNDMDEFIEAMEKYGVATEGEYKVYAYNNEYRIYRNTFFITKNACREHIKANRHHYNEPGTYAMTAWRSPQVERLWKILKETDWREVIGHVDGLQKEME